MKNIDLDRLYEIAAGQAERLSDEMYGIAYLIKKNYDLLSALSDIRSSGEFKKKLIADLTPGASKIFTDTIALLVDQGLLGELDEVSRRFTLLVAQKNNIRYDELIFSEKPGPEILGKFYKIGGDKIKFRVQIDSSIAGGFIWKTMDGKVMDASIKGRLSQMREEISA
ncbi:MAG TPA: F0F1 ATP synthase subunit delta [Candidatus Omnitrophota bacterium]|nr:F0F1 ATP synthase subunit delta [Candidatus Omnitrophota bacterium]